MKVDTTGGVLTYCVTMPATVNDHDWYSNTLLVDVNSEF